LANLTKNIDYEPVIGLEVHAQLMTRTKIFSGDSAHFSQLPNQHISLISLAHPGAMPKLNERVLQLAVRMGIACGSKIATLTTFDRKNYFYPDLPKGYQITQNQHPICSAGAVRIKNGNIVELDHVHLEEDAGKSIHDDQSDVSRIDFNRAGVPLIEIVTTPCMHSAEDAAQFLTEVRKLVRFLEICDGNMEEGSLRADANVSVRIKGEKMLGKKVEIKNMNSIRNVKSAIEAEVKRQIELINAGQSVVSETRLFNLETNQTVAMRKKEELNDYRYFPDPDLCHFYISDTWLSEVKANMPRLSADYEKLLMSEYALPEYDAQVLSSEKDIADYFLAVCEHTNLYKSASNWIMGPVKNYLNQHPDSGIPVTAEKLASLLNLIERGSVNYTQAAQRLFPALISEPFKAPEELLKELGLGAMQDDSQLELVIDEVIRIFPLKVEEYQNGKKAILTMFMGEVMKRTKGKADPARANEMLVKKLSVK
jgi:aspartyl-tRNA(Asn)/glutamyl-tRNA(Gln) amidotransferase subunit B